VMTATLLFRPVNSAMNLSRVRLIEVVMSLIIDQAEQSFYRLHDSLQE
jgi:hypothetical protein